MHIKNLETWKHSHDFAVIHKKGENRTAKVLFLTATTMAVEIIAGTAFGSMALLADGWHMGTHVAAFMITIFAYKYAKKHRNTSRFTFGTGKVTVLGGFASAVALFVVALVMSVESIQRIFAPQIIHFNEAIGVAVLGLSVNVICAFTLQADHEHHNEPAHQSHDHNLKAAYYHVLADALTSVLAIIALVSGKMFGWNWLDPVMGIIGAMVITRWSYILLKETSPILLDENIEENRMALIREIIESDSDNRICDLHLWKVGPNDYAALISLVTHFPKPVEHYKDLLKEISNLSHITIEINQCMSDPCIVSNSDRTCEDTGDSHFSGDKYKKIVVLDNIIEAQLLDSILNEQDIPHMMKSYHDSAYNGLFQMSKGWGHVEAPEEYTRDILSVLEALRTRS